MLDVCPRRFAEAVRAVAIAQFNRDQSQAKMERHRAAWQAATDFQQKLDHLDKHRFASWVFEQDDTKFKAMRDLLELMAGKPVDELLAEPLLRFTQSMSVAGTQPA